MPAHMNIDLADCMSQSIELNDLGEIIIISDTPSNPPDPIANARKWLDENSVLYTMPSEFQIKIDSTNFYPKKGTICIDGQEKLPPSLKGLGGLYQVLIKKGYKNLSDPLNSKRGTSSSFQDVPMSSKVIPLLQEPSLPPAETDLLSLAPLQETTFNPFIEAQQFLDDAGILYRKPTAHQLHINNPFGPAFNYWPSNGKIYQDRALGPMKEKGLSGLKTVLKRMRIFP